MMQTVIPQLTIESAQVKTGKREEEAAAILHERPVNFLYTWSECLTNSTANFLRRIA